MNTHSAKLPLGIALAVLAAALYAINAPFSKLLLDHMPSTLMAGFLYLGAGFGMIAILGARKLTRRPASEAPLSRRDLPDTLAMVILDIAAPVFLLMGLKTTSAASAALLNNFEIVATSLIALIVFKEKISPRLWLGILFVTLSCMLLSVESFSDLSFSPGSLLVLLAGACWGLENNCTRRLSSKDPLQIVLIKGIGSGLGSVALGFVVGERLGPWWSVPAVMAVGLVAYGLSIYFYVYAQRYLGAARTSAYYAIAPFISTGLSALIFPAKPAAPFILALIAMLIGAWLSSSDKPLFRRKHT